MQSGEGRISRSHSLSELQISDLQIRVSHFIHIRSVFRLTLFVTPAPALDPCPCPIKAALVRMITEIQDAICELYRREAHAVRQNDIDSELKALAGLTSTRSRRALLLIEYQDHIDKHRC